MNEPIPTQQPQPMGPEKPAMIRPWLLILFLVVLLAAGGYIGWYYWNKSKTATPATTTISTADWETFTDEKIGFTFKYPPSFGDIKEEEIKYDNTELAKGAAIWVNLKDTKSLRGCATTDDYQVSRGMSACEVTRDKYELHRCTAETCELTKSADGSSIYIQQATSGEGAEPVYLAYVPIANNIKYNLFTFEYRDLSENGLATFKTILSTFQFTQ